MTSNDEIAVERINEIWEQEVTGMWIDILKHVVLITNSDWQFQQLRGFILSIGNDCLRDAKRRVNNGYKKR